MFGYHVHEKAILLVLLPVSLLIRKDNSSGRIFFILSLFSIFSLFPLLLNSTEDFTKITILVTYLVYIYETLKVRLIWYEYCYCILMIPVYLFMLIIPLSTFGLHYQFLPLMVCSVYCGIGLSYCFILLYLLSLEL